jgi:small subunit ribosomal protein S8
MMKSNMSSTDPIADMLSRVRNAIAINKNVVSMPHSNAKEAIAHIINSNGFIDSVSVNDEDGRKILILVLAAENTNARITTLNRLSRPGRRTYVKAEDIPTVLRGRGIVIVSTSNGIMSGKDARDKHLGGELICEVY